MALQCHLLALPAEIRSKIWSYCVDDAEKDVAMCPCKAQPSCKHTFSSLTAIHHNSQRSCKADYENTAVYMNDLNLLFVNKQISNEAQHLYSTKILKFCSRPCLADLLRILQGRSTWIKNISIAIDLRPLRVGFTYSSSRYVEMLRDEKELLCDLANKHFSFCQFEGKEIWQGFDITGRSRHEYTVTGVLAA
jgi:hypothetical protein